MATVRQKLAFKKVLENNGSVSRAMREVNYAPGSAKNPKQLTDTKGWRELMDKYLPEEDLLKAGKEGLKATLTKFTPEGALLKLPDFATRHKYFETGLKVRSKLNPEVSELPPGTTVANFTQIIINPPHGAKSTRNRPDGKAIPSMGSTQQP